MQKISTTDEGTILRIVGDFDMSSYTDLIVTFTNPNDGTTFVKSFLAGAKITLGTVEVVDTNVNETLAANTYVEYLIETPFPFEVGYPWKALLTYENTTANPDIRTSGKTTGRFKVCVGG